MKQKIQRFREFVDESRFLDETYFIVLSVVLAFGILQTLGTGLGTEKPVVTVISTSMCPALHVGDILLVEHQSFDELSEGDIVVYDVPDTAEFEINGNEYRLRANDSDSTPSVNTSIGEVELIDVVPARNRDKDQVDLRVNGEKPVIGESRSNLVEGETYQINGETVRINYMTDLPYEGVPIVHRVVEKQDEYLETIGDNNPSQIEFESNVQPDQIHGTVFLNVPRLGLIKILGMDFVGYSGDRPFVIDNTPSCG